MKSGIDFFPLDVSLDSKMQLIEAEFGLTGFGVVVRLLQKIYGEQGYYIEWTEDVALLFAQKCGLGGNVVSEIVSASIKRGMFHPGIYEKYHVLTSRGIQKRYFEAVKRRKELPVWGDILLVDSDLLPKNACIEHKNVNISSENADISKQSKVKKSKEKKSIVKDLAGGADAPAPEDFFTGNLLEAVKLWLAYKAERKEKYQAVGLTTLFQKILKSAEQYGEHAMIDAITESIASRYAGILWDRLERSGSRPAQKPKKYVTAAEHKTEKPESTKQLIEKLRNAFPDWQPPAV